MAVILVTDAEQRAALAVVRSLGRAGHTVHLSAITAHPLAGASRFCTSVTRVPNPMTNPVANAEAHAALSKRVRADVLIPVAEATALAVLASPPPGVAVPMPDAVTFRRVCDKAAVLAAAEQVGIRVPRQRILIDRARAKDLFERGEGGALALPLILKPSRSVAGPDSKMVKLPVRYATTNDDVKSIVEDTPEGGFPLLVQEKIVGRGLGVFHLMWEGREVAAFAHRRIREKPPTGGVSTFRESIAVPPSLHARSIALLNSLGVTHGVAMVEFKCDDDAEPVLMEINGRFWGSLQLAIDAGVDFPAMLVDAALGRELPSAAPYRTGVRSRWFWGDVDHLIARVKRRVDVHGEPVSRSSLALVPMVAHEVLMARDPFSVNEIARADDWRPFLRESWQWLTRR